EDNNGRQAGVLYRRGRLPLRQQACAEFAERGGGSQCRRSCSRCPSGPKCEDEPPLFRKALPDGLPQRSLRAPRALLDRLEAAGDFLDELFEVEKVFLVGPKSGEPVGELGLRLEAGCLTGNRRLQCLSVRV